MRKIKIPTDALTILRFLEDNPDKKLESDIDWRQLGEEEWATFSSLEKYLEFLKWIGTGYYHSIGSWEEFGENNTLEYPLPPIAYNPDEDWMKIIPIVGQDAIRIDSPKQLLFNPDIIIKNLKTGREITIEKLAGDIYKGKNRLDYSLELAACHWIVQNSLTRLNNSGHKIFRVGSDFVGDLMFQTLKYRFIREEDWDNYFKTADSYGYSQLPIRSTPWRDPDGTFGIWMRPSQYFSDTLGQLPLGEPLMISTIKDPRCVKDFVRFKLNENFSVIIHFPSMKFCYIQSHFCQMFVDNERGETVNITRDQRFCYNPEGFDYPVSKNKGVPVFHHWGDSDPAAEIRKVLFKYKITKDILYQMTKEEKEILRNFKEIILDT